MSNNIKIKPPNISPTFTGLKLKKRPLIAISKKSTDIFINSQNTPSKTPNFLLKNIKKIGLLLPFLIKQRKKNNEPRKNIPKFITKENLDYIPQRGNQQFAQAEKKTLQNLPDEQYKIAEKLFFIEGRKKQLNVLDMETLYTLNAEAFNNAQKLLFIPERGEKQFSAEEINTFCVLFASKFNRIEDLTYIKERKENQFDFEGIYKIASLKEEEYLKAKELFYISERKDKQLEYNEIIKLSHLNDEGFIEAKKILYTKNRSIPLDADSIIRILEFNKTKKERIYRRNLLHDTEINNRKDSLSFNEINFISEFDDDDWKRIKEKNLLNTILNSQPSVISNELWQKILKLSNNDLGKTLKIISSNNNNVKFLNSAIVKQNGNFVFDNVGLMWAQKFAEFTEKDSIVPLYPSDVYTRGLRDKNGKIEENIAHTLLTFLNTLKNDNFDFYDIADIFQSQIRESAKYQLMNSYTSNTKCSNRNNNIFKLEDINAKINMYSKLKNKKTFKKENIVSILAKTQKNTQDFINKLLDLNISLEDKLTIIKLSEENLIFLSDKDIFKLSNITNSQCQNIIKKPAQYVNGFALPTNVIKDKVNSFIKTYKKDLILGSAIFDKETLHNILSLRFENAEIYLASIAEFNSSNLNLLSKLVNSQNIYNKPFLPTQKIQFIDLIKTYKENKMDFSKMMNMTKLNKVNIPELNIDLLKNLLKKANLTDEEINSIQNKIFAKWDLDHIHLLAKEVNNNDKETLDILKISCITENFLNHILNINNEYSNINNETKIQFFAHNLNYNKWIHPPKTPEKTYTKNEDSTPLLLNIKKDITEQINILLQTPAQNYIKKQLAQFIKSNKFELPQNYSRKNLIELLNILTDTSEKGQLHKMWNRAQKNAQNPISSISANKTLKILNSLNNIKKNINLLEPEMRNDNINLTIKMWDRNPQKDLFQGNYSTCCIGMGCGNGSAMTNYLLNTTFNMIEILDNQNNEIIGNALCFWATNTKNKPSLIIDNIEINNAQKDFLINDKNFQKAIFDYCKNIALEVCKDKNCQIYLGTHNNDIECNNLQKTNQKLCIIGNLNPENTYLDTYNGWLKTNENINKICSLYKIK